MDEQQLQEQIVQLVQNAMQGDQEATQKIQQIMQAAQQGDQQAVQLAQMIQQVAQQMQQVQAAKFGAKLNYVKRLKGKCPIGYEMRYYKVGGKLCSECIKEEKESKKPLNTIDAFKCGRKMKKKACGGSVNKKVKKGQNGIDLVAPIGLFGGTIGASAAKIIPRKKIVWSAEDPTVGIDPSGAVVNRSQEAVGKLRRKQAMQQFANDVYMQDQDLYNQQRSAVQAAKQKANNFKNKVLNFTSF